MIPSSRVADMPVQVILPEWVNVSQQEDIPLANFGGSLDYTKITNVPLPASLPTWSSTLFQSSVSLSDFGGNIDATRVNNITISYNDLLDKPVLLQGEQGPPGESIVGPPGPPGVDSTVPGPRGPPGADGSGSWSTLDKPDWLDLNLISFSNIGPYMLPPVETNFDLVVQNSVTPNTNATYNLGQKDLRYLNVWSENVACSNIDFHENGNFIGVFDGSYNSLRGKPDSVSQPEYYETLTFLPDKSLTLTAQRTGVISGLNLEATGPQISWIRADRLVCTEMSCLNGPISQVGTPELSHQAANKSYVDTRFLDYTPTDQLDLRFESIYTKKSDLQTTDLRLLTLLRNMSQTTVPDPFAFLDYYVTFLLRQKLVSPFTQTVCYHFDPVASWSFEPPLTYLDTIVSFPVEVLPPFGGDWTIGVMSLPDLQARGFTIRRDHHLDTIERRRAAVEQFTDRQWKYFSFGPSPYHVYPDPPLPPSQPPTISDVIVAPLWNTIIVGYTVSDDVEIQSVYAELLNSDSYEQIEMQQSDDVPNGAVSYSALFNFQDVTPGNSYIVKMSAIDTNDNITSQEEYVSIVDTTAPVINQFLVYSFVVGTINVGVDVSDDSGRVVAIAYLYWKEEPNDELDSWGIELTNGQGNVSFTDLDPGKTYLVELLVRDAAWNSRYDSRERVPDGSGFTIVV
jgi:hypothetical protein